MTESPQERFRARVASVRERIDSAAKAAGHDPGAVRLVAVSKYASLDQIRVALEAGQRDFGENYVKDAFAKMDELGEGAEIRWHMIGALQSNKAARAAERFDLVHSLASVRAARAMARAMQAAGRSCRALVQVHLGGGDHRAGIEAGDAVRFVEELAGLDGIVLDGVMGVAPAGENPRPFFAQLRETQASLRALGIDNAPMRELSAGMSADFEDAVREGATLVRVGSTLFSH